MSEIEDVENIKVGDVLITHAPCGGFTIPIGELATVAFVSLADKKLVLAFDNEFSALNDHSAFPFISGTGFPLLSGNKYGSIEFDSIRSYFKYKNHNIEKKSAYKAGTPIGEYIDELIGTVENKDRLKWLKVFKNCVLPPPVQSVITEALTVILCGEKFDEWGINEHFEKGLTNSILLYGPPGTGKTMISESFAAVLGKNLMKIDSSTLQSQIPGETERNIRKSFSKAGKDGCVLLFDECDSVLSNREMAGIIMGAEINCLLTEIENFKGVVILTTNRIHRLDPALARRIIAKIELPLPDAKEREQIWRNLIPPKVPLDDGIDYTILATHRMSGGEIKNAILLAARKAISNAHEKVTMMHFMDAIAVATNASEDFGGEVRVVRSDSYTNGKSGNFLFKQKPARDKHETCQASG